MVAWRLCRERYDELDGIGAARLAAPVPPRGPGRVADVHREIEDPAE